MKTWFITLNALALFPLLGFSQHSSTTADEGDDSHHHQANGQENPSGVSMQPELENDAVQVVRIVIGPHVKVPIHRISPRVIVWMSNGHLRLTFPDGKTQEERHAAGETQWLRAQEHAGENLGDKPIELIAIIPKSTKE
jgi:quercetin dioxygenase-like cupin family protein